MNDGSATARRIDLGGESASDGPALGTSGIVVLGMHRSGTSAVTRTLNLFGLSTSPTEDLIGPGRGNERGHWESFSVAQCNQALLGAVGASVYHPPPAGGQWIHQPAVQALKARCQETFTRAHPAPGWVWKDPRTCLTLDFWLDLIERPAIVLVLRHPVYVAKSLRERDSVPLEYGIALWERYVREALRSIRGLPVLTVWFDDLMDKTDSCLDEISTLLRTLKLGNPDAPRDEMRRNLDGGLRHHGQAATADQAVLKFEQLFLLSMLHGASGFRAAFPALELPREAPSTTELLGQHGAPPE